jgi:hypothetical protein
MKKRCNNPAATAYSYYGGRGIGYCERWEQFENFFEDMMPTYEPGLQIDRIDNDKDYCKENCRWTTRKVNGRNKRNNKMVTIDGKTQCVAAWAEEAGLTYSTIRLRIRRGITGSALLQPSARR